MIQVRNMKKKVINLWTKDEDDRLLEIISVEINHFREKQSLKKQRAEERRGESNVKIASSSYKCPRCGYTTNIKTKLRRHFMRKTICEAKFSTTSSTDCLALLDNASSPDPAAKSNTEEAEEEEESQGEDRESIEIEKEEEDKGEKEESCDDEAPGFKITWSQIARQMPGRNAMQCNYRWKNYLNPALSKSTWTEEEDSLLFSLYLDEYQNQLQSHLLFAETKDSEYGTSTEKNIPNNRSPRQGIPNEGVESLNSMRQNIMKNEAKLLINWTEIAHALPGRSLKSCKARIKVLQAFEQNRKIQPRNSRGQYSSNTQLNEEENNPCDSVLKVQMQDDKAPIRPKSRRNVKEPKKESHIPIEASNSSTEGKDFKC